MADRAGTTARGYGTKHQAERAKWQRRLDQGNRIDCTCPGDCGRHDQQPCPVTIDNTTPTNQWDLGHRPGQVGYAGPQCVPCNRAAGARNSNRSQHMTIREW